MSNIQTTVMRRVRTIHTLRALMGGVGVSFLVLIGSLYVIGREVWVARVFENMPRATDLLALGRFFASAFESTDMIVQLLTLLTLAAFVWLLRETARFMQPLRFV